VRGGSWTLEYTAVLRLAHAVARLDEQARFATTHGGDRRCRHTF
jgi:hypothetical protein